MDFEVPGAKRVRREDLYDRDHEGSEAEQEVDEELERVLQEKLARLYGPTTLHTFSQAAPIPTIPPSAPSDEDDAPHEFEFRLFSTATTSKAQNSEAAQKIVLEVEETNTGEGGFVRPHRDRRYYFAEKAEGEQSYKFKMAAVKGEDILEARKRRAWGLECPWRVVVVRVAEKNKIIKGCLEGLHITDANDTDQAKKKKPGKKRRIILRQRERKRVEDEEKRRKEVELKNESEKDKKIRRNREKKLKKRQKEKAEKAAKRKEAGVEDGPCVATSKIPDDSTAGQLDGA